MIELTHSQFLTTLSFLLNFLGGYAYLRDTLAGKTQPNRITWLLWALVPLVAAIAASGSCDDMWAVSRIVMASMVPSLVFLASFKNKGSVWRLGVFDVSCAGLSVFAMLVWWLSDEPLISLFLACLADGFAALPTIRKAWQYPETETFSAYLAGFVSIGLLVAAEDHWKMETTSFLLFLLLINSLLLSGVFRGKLIGLRRNIDSAGKTHNTSEAF